VQTRKEKELLNVGEYETIGMLVPWGWKPDMIGLVRHSQRKRGEPDMLNLHP